MGRTACTQPQCLYKGAFYFISFWWFISRRCKHLTVCIFIASLARWLWIMYGKESGRKQSLVYFQDVCLGVGWVEENHKKLIDSRRPCWGSNRLHLNKKSRVMFSCLHSATDKDSSFLRRYAVSTGKYSQLPDDLAERLWRLRSSRGLERYSHFNL